MQQCLIQQQLLLLLLLVMLCSTVADLRVQQMDCQQHSLQLVALASTQL
jgi:hypothetical protein